ncbi:MAG: hypothetical protein KAG61_10310 [Bacteriovoracaceae bacterium]|nr:hypothetical protein [Bacteriovoracaceae bacterium]
MNLEWYLPDPSGVSPIGPFSTEEIEGMVEAGKLSLDSFLCSPELVGEEWKRVFEYSQFNKFLKTSPICPPPKVFSKGIYKKPSTGGRKIIDLTPVGEEQRIEIDAEVILHDNTSAHIGKVNKIGTNGFEIRFSTELEVGKGSEFISTIFNSRQLHTFSAKCAVLGVKQVGGHTIVEAYFLRVNPINKRNIIGLFDSGSPVEA